MKRSGIIKVSLALLIFVGIHQHCIYKIGNFEVRQIVSDIENSPEWEVSAKPALHLLEQKFTFLGMGDQAYAFLGEDKMTVLKLFKHYDAQGKRPLHHIFESCKLAYELLKEETGLIYLHINKEKTPLYITLIDKLGFFHKVNINQTEYAIQKKADGLIFDRLAMLLKKGDIASIKQHIHVLFELIAQRCAKGIGDRDTALRRNYGYLSMQPIALDIGSYFVQEELKEPVAARIEIAHKTHRLLRWLKKHAPELIPYYESELVKISG
ncbi:MAG: hypothetical protein V4494_03580 [Chlamydiota bacterium]